MDNLYIQEIFVNRTRDAQFGESDVYESAYSDKGQLYRACQREYGRCTSKVYVDTNKRTKAIGWVFQGRSKYDDSNETYLREVWVTVHDAPPTETIEYHYAD